jgi:hypothetical protein
VIFHDCPSTDRTIVRKTASPKNLILLGILSQPMRPEGIGNVEKMADFGGGNRMISGHNTNYFDNDEDHDPQLRDRD